MTDAAPALTYWHLWTDPAGVSRQTRCTLSGFALHGIGDAAPQWNKTLPGAGSEIVFTVQPVGWVGDWHENPAPQWIAVLSGAWWIESMDGTRIEQRAGEVCLGADQHCRRDAHGRLGHRSGTLGDQPAVLMCVRLDGLPPGACVFG
jgi:hypothetical protein